MGTPVAEDDVGLPSAAATASQPRVKSKLLPLPPLNSSSSPSSLNRDASPLTALPRRKREAEREEICRSEEKESAVSGQPVSTAHAVPGQPISSSTQTLPGTATVEAEGEVQTIGDAPPGRYARYPAAATFSLAPPEASGIVRTDSPPESPNASLASPKQRPRRRSLADAVEAGSAMVGSLFARSLSNDSSSASGTARRRERRASSHGFTGQYAEAAKEQLKKDKAARQESGCEEKRSWFGGSAGGSAVQRSGSTRSHAGVVRSTSVRKNVIDRIFRPFSSHSDTSPAKSPARRSSSGSSSPFIKFARSPDTKTKPIQERAHSAISPDKETLAMKIQRKKTEMEGAAAASGETAKSRWVKANWHALEEASALHKEAQAKTHAAARGDAQEDKFANMVNVLMYAVTWRRKALGARHTGDDRPRMRLHERVFSHPAYVLLNWLCSMYTIFAWDVNVMAGGAKGRSDDVVLGINAALLFVFLMDWSARLVCFKLPFLCSMESAFDLLAIVSLLPDLVWFTARVDIFKVHHDNNFPTAIRALRVGFRAVRSLRLASFAIRERSARVSVHNLPQDLNSDLDHHPRPSVGSTVGAAVEYQAVLVIAWFILLNFLYSALWFEGQAALRLEGDRKSVV